MEIIKFILKAILFIIILFLFMVLVSFSDRKNARFESEETKKEYNKYGTILLVILAVCCYLMYLLK